MTKRKIILNYIAIASFIFGWWLFAFTSHHSVLNIEKITSQVARPFSSFESEKAFFSIDTDHLKSALAGDFKKMSELISEWDIDTQILQAKGHQLKRLSSSDFLRSQILIRNIDRLSFEKQKIQLLPQTFAAASLLLAIAPIDQIVALPKYLREQQGLFPKNLTDKIPLDIDRCYGEKLYLAKPDIAFVAEYSHPATLEAFQNQGIQLYMMHDLTNLENLSQELIELGKMTGRQDQAEILKIFMHAAIIALDNRQHLIIERYRQKKIPLPSVLVLNYHSTFSIPSKDTLNGKILERLHAFDIRSKKGYNKLSPSLLVDNEQLVNLNPTCLIVVTSDKIGLKNEMEKDSALSSLMAVKTGKVFFVDEAVHHSPTQYAILAYSELIEILDKKL